LIEKHPGETPWIGNIHVFAIASSMSFGPSGSSINAMTTAVRKLVDGITRGLFRSDVERHWQSLLAYDVPQAVMSAPVGAAEPLKDAEGPAP
jgi:FAD-dependent urate hydroxylase